MCPTGRYPPFHLRACEAKIIPDRGKQKLNELMANINAVQADDRKDYAHSH